MTFVWPSCFNRSTIGPERWSWLDQPCDLLTVVPRVPGVHGRRYKPLRKETGLFQIFANTPPTERGVLHFAERYGRLGELLFYVRSNGDIPSSGEALHDVRSVHGWADEIRLVKDTLDGFEKSSRVMKGGIPIREYGRRIINLRLGELVAPHLGWGPDRTGLRLTYVPKNLLGAIWMQLALALGHDKQYPHCTYCKQPFEISLDKQTGQRADSIFCSDRCKSADYRARRRKAQELSQKGIPLSAIAKKLRTTVPTVKKWLARSRSTRRRAT